MKTSEKRIKEYSIDIILNNVTKYSYVTIPDGRWFDTKENILLDFITIIADVRWYKKQGFSVQISKKILISRTAAKA